MTVLVDYEIRKYIEDGIIGVDPYNPERINSNSLDLTLGEGIKIEDDDINPCWENTYPSEPDSYPVMKDLEPLANICGDKILYKIEPRTFALATTTETITLPNFICAHVSNKSSIARLGNQIEIGGWIDCGFSGQITLEMYNLCKKPIVLSMLSMPIAQIVFYKTMPSESDYGHRKSSKYQNQTGPTPSKYYLNKLIE